MKPGRQYVVMRRYRAYGQWLQETFGERVYKVSVDGGFTCPNRDGTVALGGCTYCNNNSFRADGTSPRLDPESQVKEGIAYVTERFQARKFVVYWQNYSNTYAPVEQLEALYRRSLESDPRVVGLSIGTRADCVQEEKLEMIQSLSSSHHVCLEYGLESVYDETLRRLNRGHDVACFRDAVLRTHQRGIPVCAHVILGFPWESREQILEDYPRLLNQLPIQFLKIHHLHIVKNTALAREYFRAPFPVLQYREWIELVCDFIERLDPRIVIQRLFGWTPDQYLVAPRWGKPRAEILADISLELERRDGWQGSR
jgi:uncharacterized protein